MFSFYLLYVTFMTAIENKVEEEDDDDEDEETCRIER